MRNITKIFTLVLSLILLFAVSCSNDDKTGVPNNPPENDTEITDGETGGSSGTGSGGTGTSGETGGSGSGSETGGSGTGGSGEGGSGSGSGSGEGGSGEVTPPSEPEIVTEIDEEGFPRELLGTYRDERIYNMYKDERDDAKVSLSGVGIWMRGTQMRHKKDGSADGTQSMDSKIKKWKKTTKGGKIIKLEGESFSTRFDEEKNEKITVAKTVIIYDYENKTVSMTFTASTYTPDGVDASFYGKKIN